MKNATLLLKTKGLLSKELSEKLGEEIKKFKNLDEDPYITALLSSAPNWANEGTVNTFLLIAEEFKPRYKLEQLFVLGMLAKSIPAIGGRESLPLLTYLESALAVPEFAQSNEKHSLDLISNAIDAIKTNQRPTIVYGLDGSGYIDPLDKVVARNAPTQSAFPTNSSNLESNHSNIRTPESRYYKWPIISGLATIAAALLAYWITRKNRS
ncbi:MAG: hypothetical protein RL376_820 [Verrucomicrobiota bacterium]